MRGGCERLWWREVLHVREAEHNAAVGRQRREEALPAGAAEGEQLLLCHHAAGCEPRLPDDRREAFAHLLLRTHFGHHEDRHRRLASALLAVVTVAIVVAFVVRCGWRLRRLRGDRLLHAHVGARHERLVIQVALVTDEQHWASRHRAAHELLEQPLLRCVLRLVRKQRVLVERLLHELQVAPHCVVQRHQLVGHHFGRSVALQAVTLMITIIKRDC